MSEADGAQAAKQFRVERAVFERYDTFLQEKSRPPSRGGNTKALHAHRLTINGQAYSFLAFGARQWVFKRDTVSFNYFIKGTYLNILPETLVTKDASGNAVVRGDRGFNKKLRAADARMPASRREQRS